jgi:hypothetical protein
VAWDSPVYKVVRVTVTTAAVGLAALSPTAPAHAGNRSAVGAGIVGFGIGAVLGSALTPREVYVAPPPPPVYYVPPPPPPVYYGPVIYGPPYRAYRGW